MTVTAADLPVLLEDRVQAQKALDRWGGYSASYEQTKSSLSELYRLYRQDWSFMWPDKKGQAARPMVPDLIRLAAEDRASTITASRPSIVCRPAKVGDTARTEADLRERIVASWWDRNRVMGMVPGWAFDAMFAGLTVCEVWPQTAGASYSDGRIVWDKPIPKDQRYPTYQRLEPATVFPGPTFARGPYLDDCVVSYMEEVGTLQYKYGVNISNDVRSDTKRVRCIKYYTHDRTIVIAEYPKPGYKQRGYRVLQDARHDLGCVPILIGVRPTADGIYHGEFDNAVEMINFANKFANMMLDDAILKVYAETIETEGVNSEESGPGGRITLESPQDRYEKVQHPNQPFSNLQLQKQLLESVRTSVILSPARTGDSNASVISAAGITAEQAQFLEAVARTQRDVLKPMLEAANEVAFKCDVAYSGDVKKSVYLSATGEEETYNPATDIGDAVQNEVVYGSGTALDPINRSVLAGQQVQMRLMSRQRAMELGAWIDDTQREEKQMLAEALDDAGVAGLTAAAAQGGIPPEVWSKIKKAVKNDGVSLEDAFEEFLVAAPLAQPVGSAPLPNLAPGIAGAAEGGAQETAPPVPDLAALGL